MCLQYHEDQPTMEHMVYLLQQIDNISYNNSSKVSMLFLPKINPMKDDEEPFPSLKEFRGIIVDRWVKIVIVS